ncbi:hypothetical protein [Salisaeta longa]|uniref:hypothetical protein n=1 Tax=Salisaeta longa TaxID=503170 RepID=UPI00040D4499|nr:hypothetical protein [Salisaeta longa]
MADRTSTVINDQGQFITVGMPDHQPAEDRLERAHHDFITGHWMDIAAASFYGFKKIGIGAVVVAATDPATADVEHTMDTRKLMYAPDHGAWLDDRVTGPLAAWFTTKLQTYDPNTEALALMADDDGTLRGYTVEGSPDPGTCFELVRARQN